MSFTYVTRVLSIICIPQLEGKVLIGGNFCLFCLLMHLLERKDFPLLFKILPASLPIKLTYDRLTGDNKQTKFIICTWRENIEIETQSNDECSFILFRQRNINLWAIDKKKEKMNV